MNIILSKPKSITHAHLLGVILAEAGSRKSQGRLRILDAGCGSGDLLAYLYEGLALLLPGLNVELFGFDVSNHGVQAVGFLSEAETRLRTVAPTVDWGARVCLIADCEAWPYESESFDMVVSNQVLEHVRDHQRFFLEQNRVLKAGGCGIHLFPLKGILWEGHLYIPIGHWIENWDVLRWWITICSRLGIGKFKKSGMSLTQYSEGHADYLLHYTNYINKNELLRLSKNAGFRTSFAFTADFYKRKLRIVLAGVLGSPSPWSMRSWLDVFLFWLFHRASSITTLQVKADTYLRFE